ncbi:hypothetical protein HID58_001962 [Brassica napus]|uniref:Uncharacterized protein n=3 Tax=Brassica TaxID=3705 RepID=A0ABQ8ENU4_BRANA|nr:hypothetical protein HID58_001962 [Brassica napus]CDY22904.1 BnaA01g18420D [Brassica napus]VDC75606.1 unnamed protein product [Brassica rapa]
MYSLVNKGLFTFLTAGGGRTIQQYIPKGLLRFSPQISSTTTTLTTGSITCTTPNRVTEALLSPDIRFLFGDIVPSVGSACDVWG